MFEQYKLYTDEELKEITVKNGYTDEAENVAKMILSGDRVECKEFIKQQEKKEQENEYIPDKNTIGGVIKGVGILILIIGTIGSLLLGSEGYKFSSTLFIYAEIGTVILSLFFFGLSEIIKLLHSINSKL